MLNLGKVEIKGMDVTVRGGYSLKKNMRLTLDAGYTLQMAEDKSVKGSASYGRQIAYTPQHSGTAALALLSPWLNGSYSVVFSGYRYDLSHLAIDGYADSAISLWKNLNVANVHWEIKAEALNLFDTHYVVVNNYPMPGRSWRVGLTMKL
jgi:outer membrane receptor protein involved in Fe transport